MTNLKDWGIIKIPNNKIEKGGGIYIMYINLEEIKILLDNTPIRPLCRQYNLNRPMVHKYKHNKIPLNRANYDTLSALQTAVNRMKEEGTWYVD